MKIGVIADTHGHLDPQVPECFAGVMHILHAGDIGDPLIIHELETIAPVTAVAGNNDPPGQWPERAVVTLAGWRFVVQHIVELQKRATKEPVPAELQTPGVVVFGHTHRPHAEWREGRLFFNPGYAGRPRLGLRRSVAVLEVDARAIQHRFFDL